MILCWKCRTIFSSQENIKPIDRIGPKASTGTCFIWSLILVLFRHEHWTINIVFFQGAFSVQRPFSADPAHSAQPFSCHPGPYAEYVAYHQQNWPSFGYIYEENFVSNFPANYPNSWTADQWRHWNSWGQHQPQHQQQQQQQQHQTQPVLQNSLGPMNPNVVGNLDPSYQRTLDYVQQCQSWSNSQAQKF